MEGKGPAFEAGRKMRVRIELSNHPDTTGALIAGYNYRLLQDFAKEIGLEAEIRKAAPDTAGRMGRTLLDEVYVWGDGEVSSKYPEAIVPIHPGDALLFTNAAAGAVSILPMPIPHLSRKPSGATPSSFPVTMARNETETRYFAIVNGTDEKREVALSADGFGEGVRADIEEFDIHPTWVYENIKSVWEDMR